MAYWRHEGREIKVKVVTRSTIWVGYVAGGGFHVHAPWTSNYWN